MGGEKNGGSRFSVIIRGKIMEEKLTAGDTALNEYKDFAVFADIRCLSEQRVIKECKLFEIRQIMSNISAAIVRNELSEREKKELIERVLFFGMKGVVASPCYLNSTVTAIKKAKSDVRLISVVDFPFGEGSIKSHLADVKESASKGVDGVMAVFSASLFNSADFKETKKRIKKLGKLRSVDKYFAVSAMDLTAGGIKRLVKMATKYKIDGVSLLFGDAKETEAVAKINEIKAAGLKKPVSVFANVRTLNAVKILYSLKADEIITPFADEIAAELIKKFDVAPDTCPQKG